MSNVRLACCVVVFISSLAVLGCSRPRLRVAFSSSPLTIGLQYALDIGTLHEVADGQSYEDFANALRALQNGSADVAVVDALTAAAFWRADLDYFVPVAVSARLSSPTGCVATAGPVGTEVTKMVVPSGALGSVLAEAGKTVLGLRRIPSITADAAPHRAPLDAFSAAVLLGPYCERVRSDGKQVVDFALNTPELDSVIVVRRADLDSADFVRRTNNFLDRLTMVPDLLTRDPKSSSLLADWLDLDTRTLGLTLQNLRFTPCVGDRLRTALFDATSLLVSSSTTEPIVKNPRGLVNGAAGSIGGSLGECAPF